MNNYELSDSTLSGQWWFPSTPGDSVSGTLIFDTTKSILDLDHSLNRGRGNLTGQTEYGVIHGTTSDAEAITIFGALGLGVSVRLRSAGVRLPEQVLCRYVLVGVHVEQNFFPYMSFRIPGLLAWLDQKTITSSMIEDSTPRKFRFEVDTSPLGEHKVPEIGGTIRWDTSTSIATIPHGSVNVELEGRLRIEPETPQTVDWYLEHHRCLTRLIQFCAGSSMAPDKITSEFENKSFNILVALPNNSCSTFNRSNEYFLPKTHLNLDFGEATSNWLHIYDKVRIPSALAESILFSNDGGQHHSDLLTLMQCLEGLHRALHKGTYTTDKEYSVAKTSLTRAIPKTFHIDHRQSLKSRIKYGNQISLAKRLKELSEYFSVDLRKVLLDSVDIPRAWIDTRNYYTHWDEEDRGSLLEGAALYHTNVRLKMFITAAYLHIVGISDDAILKALEGTSRFSRNFSYSTRASRELRGSSNP